MNRAEYARISLTPRCTLRCRYCVGEGERPGLKGRHLLSYSELLTLIEILKEEGIKKFRFTGGEPLLREGVFTFFKQLDLVNWGVSTSLSVPGVAFKLNCSPLKNLNVSLDTLDERKYKWITRGGELKTVIENLDKLKGKNIKLNTILIKDFNFSDAEDIIKFAHKRNILPRFIEKMDFIPDGLEKSSGRVLRKKLIGRGVIKKEFFREAASACIYHSSGRGGLPVGFILPVSRSFCADCNRIRITSSGAFKLCLFSEPGFKLSSSLLSDRKAARKAIAAALKAKSPGRTITGGRIYMSAVGG